MKGWLTFSVRERSSITSSCWGRGWWWGPASIADADDALRGGWEVQNQNDDVEYLNMFLFKIGTLSTVIRCH